jgi:xylan 1,4-beta-xylosidase
MEFEPQHFQQMAGWSATTTAPSFTTVRVARRRRHASARDVGAARSGERRRVHRADPDPGQCPIDLRVEVDYERLRFAYRLGDAGEWQWLPQLFDASILSDEATAPGLPNFTGAFVGWRARISPARRGRQTSTGSSIASATTSRDVEHT